MAISLLASPLYADIDLEKIAQDFVLETRQIRIPGYPTAFNPSVVKWKNQWLMVFRCIQSVEIKYSSCSDSKLGLIWLDETFNPIGDPEFITLDHPDKKRPNLLLEDPRLIVKNDQLYLIYSANKEADFMDRSFRVYVAELEHDSEGFYVVHNECLSNFEGHERNKREKNWVPFIYDDQLFLAYHLLPHKIFKPLLDGTGHCEVVASSLPSFIWEWGELRGGTPAVQLSPKYYLSIFHSSIPLATVHSDNQHIPHYFMGAYLFSTKPPFKIEYVSPEPIIGPNFYHGEKYEPYWHPLCVVFPGGLIVEEKEIYILYGRQDHEIWIAKIDKEQLYKNLIHISTFPSFEDEIE